MNANFGTSIRDLIMDPLTEETKAAVVSEVNDVINADPKSKSRIGYYRRI